MGENRVLGVRRSWRAGADCKSVVLRLRWFESTHSHQNKKWPKRVIFYFVVVGIWIWHHANASWPVRKQVDCGSVTHHNRHGFPAGAADGIHPRNLFKEIQIDFWLLFIKAAPTPTKIENDPNGSFFIFLCFCIKIYGQRHHRPMPMLIKSTTKTNLQPWLISKLQI